MGGLNAIRILGAIVIFIGLVALALGSFNYTKETHEAHVGPVTLTVKDARTINFPVWAGVAGIVIGSGLLLFGPKRS